MAAGLYWLFAVGVAVALQVSGPTVRIAVVGDTGDGTAEVARGVAAVRPVDAIILTGDNFYPCGVKSATDPQWSRIEPLASLGIPIYPVLGNHDVCGNAEAQLTAPYRTWKFPAREYVIQSAVADFMMLDTTPYAEGNQEWRTGNLACPDRQDCLSSTKWRIAVGHHPLLSSGYHGYMPRDEHRKMLRLIPLMRAARIDLYIAGHDHHLELLDGNPRMLVSGAGSRPIPAVLRRGGSRWVSEAPFIGFAILELTAKTMTIRFYDEKGVARSKAFTYSR